MQKTLLRMVQDILYDMDSDEINSIGDTVESTQVARKIENVFWDVVSRLDLPRNSTLFELQASNDANLPNIMYVHEKTQSIESVKYFQTNTDGTQSWVSVSYVPYEDFIEEMYQRDPSDPTVDTVTLTRAGGQTFKFYPYNDRAPSKFTSYNDYTLVFDAYESDINTTLVRDKTAATGKVFPSFEQTDLFIPPVPPEAFNLFFLEAKQACFADMKQTENVDAGRRARKNWVKQQVDKKVIGDPYSALRNTPNYGRTRKGATLRVSRNSW